MQPKPVTKTEKTNMAEQKIPEKSSGLQTRPEPKTSGAKDDYLGLGEEVDPSKLLRYLLMI